MAENHDLQGMSDQQLFKTIQHGIPGSGMPAFKMPEQQIWEVAAYVRSLSSPAYLAPVLGNSSAGRKLFYGQSRCATCHAIHSEGGRVGPDLTNIGADMTLLKLKESILQPSASIAPGFDAVTVLTRDGKTIAGVAKDNSIYSIQILDANGALHLFNKNELDQIEWSRTSLMPDDVVQKLSPACLNDLLAFLAEQTLRPASDMAQPRHEREIH